MYDRILAATIALYATSLITTMAGMEIFSWLTFLLVVGGLIYQKVRPRTLSNLKLQPLGADNFVWMLLVVVILGVFINGSHGINATESIGSMRWILLLYALLAGILYFADIPERFFHAFLVISAVVAVNSLIMYLTGFNPIRNEQVDYATEGAYRGSGFFSIPTTYAHSAAMICCLSISALMTNYKPFRGAKWFFGFVALLVGLSVVTSYTRAAYISLTVALCLMALVVSRKLFWKVIVALFFAGAVLFITNDGFQQRLSSIFDLNYASNSQRLELWRAHFEMFKDHPILGLGLHDNERRNAEYNIKLGQEGAHTGNAHNNYLQFLAGTGLVGLTLYLLFIAYYLRLSYKIWKKKDEYNHLGQVLALGILGAQVSFHVAGFMDSNFKDAEVKHLFLFLTVVLSAMSLGVCRKSQSSMENR